MRARRGPFSLVILMAGCAGPSVTPTPVADPEPDALYTDFLGAKLDGAGHPIGAFVLEGEGCASETGEWVEGGLALEPSRDVAGLACAGTTDLLGRGRFAVNVRLARLEDCEPNCDAELLTVRALDPAGFVLAERAVHASEVAASAVLENHALELPIGVATAVRVEVVWAGVVPARLAYVEVFRRDRQLVLEPISGVPMADARFRAEMVDPPEDAQLTLRCAELDRTAALEALLASGEAVIEETDYRRILTAPMAPLLEGCALPARLVGELRRPDRVYATSETYVMAEPLACPADDGRPLVILTGFLPFPAGSSSDNSSHEAVVSFNASAVPEARVLPVVLPVEFDTAASLVLDLVERCEPDVVIGFGQGRWQVDLETTAYNAKDTSEVAGGVPDNRGLVLDGAAIRDGGPAELASRLPIDAILRDLTLAGVPAGTSDDPGRYVCNSLFYALAHDAPPEARVGFVHLPILRSVGPEDRATLQRVVAAAVRRSL